MISKPFRPNPIALACLIACSGAAHAQSASGDLVAPTVEVSASADASAAGLEPAYAGGQVAKGGRVGLFGNMDYMDAPFNSMNYTRELIQDQQARSIGDVVLNDPSVRVARGFGNFQELYMVRGFPLASDDMMYNGLFGVLPRQFVAAELFERVEVLRGANSFMNGATPGIGAVGGVVNLVPKRAPNAPLNEVTVGVDSGVQGYAAADFARRFGDDQSTGLRLNAVVRNGDTPVDDEQRQLGSFLIGFDHRGENFRLSADIGYQDHRLDSPRPNVGVLAGVPVPAAPDASKNYAQPWTYSDERDTFGTLRGELDIAKDVVAWAAFGMRRGSENNSLSLPTVTDAAGNARLDGFDNTREDTVQTGEVGIRGKFHTGGVSHSVSANYSAYALDLKSAFTFGFGNGATNIYSPVAIAKPANGFAGGNLDSPLTTEKTELSSFAVADTLGFVDDRLLLTLGARQQNISDKNYDSSTGALLSDYDDDAVTPLVAAMFRITPQVSVYANYVESLSKGQNAPAGTINAGQSIAPFKSRQKEVGVKYDGGSIGGSIAMFTTDLPLAIIENSVFSTDGEQRNRGVEFTVFGEPVRHVRVLGGVTFLDSEQVRTANGVNQGKEAIGIPDTQLNLDGEWDIPGMERLTLTGRVLYTSSQYLDAANTQEMPSWTRVDVGARYVVDMGPKALTLRAGIENLFDRDYWASAGGYPGQGYLVLANPRTYTLTATLGF
ncbi:MAG TPA: TonB-dependent siderophore receptor [Burkholderiales bacterium]|nr:TonB-dependent siderophore receptor [Burkholderiales bacterium]